MMPMRMVVLRAGDHGREPRPSTERRQCIGCAHVSAPRPRDIHPEHSHMLACFVPRLRRAAGYVTLALALATVAACGDDDPEGPGNGNGARTVTTDNATLVYGNANLTIPAGATVTFQLSTVHDADFESASIPDFAFGVGGTRTFNVAGTYRYRCTAHSTNYTSGMVGTITVQ
jgi:plastocyanin